MAKPTYTPPPNEAPILGDPSFAAKAQGFLGWFPVMGEYMQGMGEWIETMIGDVPSDNIAAFAHLGGAANKLPYFTGAGAMAMADLTADGRSLIGQSGVLKANGAVLGGTGIQQDAYDTTLSRILKTGAFGLGIPAGTSGMATYDMSDFYANSSGIYFLGGSGGAPTNWGTMWVMTHSTYAKTLLYQDSGGRRMFIGRHNSDSSLTGWFEVFTENNVVGTVGYDGTKPTGAVIQTGSNANGDYTRFADGTQECWNKVSLAYEGPTLISASWTYPAAFSSIPVLQTTLNVSSLSANVGPTGLAVCGVGTPSATGTAVRLYRSAGATDFASGNSAIVHVRATGRWR
ncbi:hypothetical protein [Thioclava sp. GXIMD2076]|uniref:hypothetical protein n=1 Tax=Thioclava sp. GXIMD2076 TaxID=3131931 RepID=UPI0030D1E9F7